MEKRLIVMLIESDLIHNRLTYALEDLGFDTIPYSLHIHEFLFEVMELPDLPVGEDEAGEYYSDMLIKSKKINFLSIDGQEKARKLAEEILDGLIRIKLKIDKRKSTDS